MLRSHAVMRCGVRARGQGQRGATRVESGETGRSVLSPFAIRVYRIIYRRGLLGYSGVAVLLAFSLYRLLIFHVLLRFFSPNFVHFALPFRFRACMGPGCGCRTVGENISNGQRRSATQRIKVNGEWCFRLELWVQIRFRHTDSSLKKS